MCFFHPFLILGKWLTKTIFGPVHHKIRMDNLPQNIELKDFSFQTSKTIADDDSGYEEWTVVEEKYFRDSSADVEDEIQFIPEFLDTSDILDNETCIQLLPYLPTRVQGSAWYLIYSTERDGYALRNLLRKTQNIQCPTLLVVCCSKGHVFGAIMSCAPKFSKHFDGNGESAVFVRDDEDFKVRVYKWNDENNYNIVKGGFDGICVGCGSGASAIWLDEDLYRGRTQKCQTFENVPLCSCGDFFVKSVELWGFL